ncbi:MAG: protein-L-isoaspartate O-methyltransferase [Nitrosomonas sp.]|nr:protein-L-isoaspartate O-methyltransferase [Nitrosomonas sp.]
MNLEETRFNMVEQQIRTWSVLDDTVLELLYKMHREDFVPAEYKSMAFVDMEIPLGHGQLMHQPKFEARILQEVQVQKTDKILEVGTGSGYLTALLAAKGDHVYSVEIVPELKAMAEANLKAHDITNVTLEEGDASHGWPEHAPYDVIIITASTPVLPETFKQCLNPGGRLFAIIGQAPIMNVVLITCEAPGVFNTKPLFETYINPLSNAQQAEQFVF